MESPTNVANYVKGEMLIEAKMLEAKAEAEAKHLSRNIMLILSLQHVSKVRTPHVDSH